MSRELDDLRSQLKSVMQRDQFRLRRQVNDLSKKKSSDDFAQRLATLTEAVTESAEKRSRRLQNQPTPKFDTDLPIYERRAEIADAIRNNQVVVVSGETGSGKSTQLPLIALEMGFGVAGLIGHTQPRRIAARSVASRIASQMGVKLGTAVGFKIRFSDQTSEQTYIKLMTDGILLAETQTDRFLDQYELLIVDEAHERSLNIDFLLGYLKRILVKKPNLRLVITSATIDTEKFAKHFTEDVSNPVPIINVEGRTYPVDIRYKDPETEAKGDDLDALIVATCQELAAEDPGDMLVFLPTERDIRQVHRKMKGANFKGPATEVLPLYARLSTAQQNQIFQTHKGRRIVLATNVAESSVTVPGIKFVVDTGTARISRYAPRSKVQRLPIEAVSQASANQRAGRCGRIGPGICVRLYSEEDYLGRNDFTTPEIRRTNLASVILQTLALRLGDLSEFPFIDPPGVEAIRDGYKTLFEIGATNHHRKLTPLGRKLSRFPVDPRIGRMIYQADDENCVAEILIIASALEIQDPRVRPPEKQQAADAAHEQWSHPKSDFLSFLKLWDFFHKLKADLSQSKLRKACAQNFLSYTLMRQWEDIHRQLKSMVAQSGLKPQSRRDDYNAIHRSLLAGLLSGVAMLGDRHEFTGTGGIKFHLWPGSGVFESKPKWIVAAEIVETSKRYGRVIAKIAPEWIESIGEHLVKRHYSDPHWSKKQQTVMAHERVTLFGLPIIQKRQTGYTRINREESRDIFIEKALGEGEYEGTNKFYAHNVCVLEKIKNDAAKTRDRELIVDSYLVNGFYDEHLPLEAVDTLSLRKLIKSDPQLDARLRITRERLLGNDSQLNDKELFPDDVQVGAMQIPVSYQFAPGAKDDGATVVIPAEGIGQIDSTQADWLIPGLMEKRVVGLIRSLPKSVRRNFVPATNSAQEVVANIEFGKGSFLDAVAKQLSRIAGEPVDASNFKLEDVDQHLRINIRVVDAEGETLAEGRSVADVRSQLGAEYASNVVQSDDSEWNQSGLKEWSWGEFPKEVIITRGHTSLAAFPTIIDEGESVGLQLVDSTAASNQQSKQGLVRLLKILNRKSIRSQVNWLPNLDSAGIQLARIVPTRTLKEQLGDLIARIAFVETCKIPRDLEQFEQLQLNQAEKIGIATQEIAKWLPKWADAVHNAYLKLEKMPGQFSSAKGDIREQIKGLATEHFLARTPWFWLKNYPRYFDAIAFRIDKLSSTNPEKERAMREEVAALSLQYQQRLETHLAQGIVDPELDEFRWMIEEYRVSLFAQTLGTAVTVSAKRLEKQFSKARQA